MFAHTRLFANNRSTLQAQYWLMPKNRHTIFFYRYALAISSMMHYHLKDLIKSEHLQIINLFAYFTIKEISILLWRIIIFIHILTLLFQDMMPHNSHIPPDIPMDEMRPPILSYKNCIITFVLFFPHFHAHVRIFSCSFCFSALQKLVEFGMEVMFWTSIGDPVHYIYCIITLFHAFNIYPDIHASILVSCYP